MNKGSERIQSDSVQTDSWRETLIIGSVRWNLSVTKQEAGSDFIPARLWQVMARLSLLLSLVLSEETDEVK